MFGPRLHWFIQKASSTFNNDSGFVGDDENDDDDDDTRFVKADLRSNDPRHFDRHELPSQTRIVISESDLDDEGNGRDDDRADVVLH